jgi:predicted aspartyl protease
MMQGKVNQNCETILSVTVRNIDIIKSFETVIDTGFSGFLTLPSDIIAELDLTVKVHIPPFLSCNKTL